VTGEKVKRPLKKRMLRLFGVVIFAILIFTANYVGRLYFGQWRMIYHPHPYQPSYRTGLPDGTVELEYTTQQGTQVAFYIPPQDASPDDPDPLWVMFNGNASLALDWLDVVENFPDDNTGFLLVDYPGYGKCEGKPRSKRILENSERSLDVLAKHLKVDRSTLEDNMNIMGFSIGGASCLQFAAKHKPKKVILISTFTSLKDMAKLAVGSLLSNLLLEKYDNRARLDELAAMNPPPEMHIFHGEADTTVPFRMSKELAERHPDKITFHPYKKADHGSIIDTAINDIYSAMTK
jgi:pimeloyl-ACP methyl ester carboxylesterase